MPEKEFLQIKTLCLNILASLHGQESTRLSPGDLKIARTKLIPADKKRMPEKEFLEIKTLCLNILASLHGQESTRLSPDN